MNPKRLVIAIVAVFVATFATDFLIHAVWLDARYKETASLWRPEAEMQAHMGWLMLGQFLFAATFTILWAKGFAATACIRCGCVFGACVGVLVQTTTLITYAVQPFPADIAVKWFVAGVVQGVLLGLVAFFVYKPKPEAAKI
ncbi:MAG: hypothetical protein HY043_01220 [Verrucomicrobia bacterium]|nr:hypothetical protein [Verrucomicrobiota bacterium]